MTIRRWLPLILVLVILGVDASFWARTRETDALLIGGMIAALGVLWLVLVKPWRGGWP